MNNNNSILLLDPSFDPKDATNCSLLVNLGVDYFSYAIVDEITGKVIAIFDEQECINVAGKFAERSKTDSYLSLPYQDIKIAIYTPNVIAVPNELYADTAIATHTQFFNELQHTEVKVQKQASFGYTAVFNFPKPTLNVATSLANPKIFHQYAGLVQIATGLDDTLLFDFSAGSFTILCLKQEQIIFQYTYQIENIEEFNYYLLFIINQLTINTAQMHVLLSGIINDGDARHLCLLKYFNSVNFLTVDGDLNANILEEMPAHYYVNLLALHKCEL